MQNQTMLKLIFREKSFSIPSNFRYLNDVNPDILSSLITNHQYKIQSNVSKEVFKYFIKHWTTNELPSITSENLSEYDQLSREFDRMKEIIALFKMKEPYIHNSSTYKENKKLENEKIKKNKKLYKEFKKHEKIIDILFDNRSFDGYSNLFTNKAELYYTIINESIDLVSFLTKKIITKDGLTFSLNEDDKTATLFRILSKEKRIYIPQSIIYESKEFIITRISQYAFNEYSKIKIINFSNDSKIQKIDKKAFHFTHIKTISIPSHVKKISKETFKYCEHLYQIEIPENSELEIIDKNAFESTNIESLFIPSNVKELRKEWCHDLCHLNYIKVAKENKNFIFYDNKFLLGKTEPKNDAYDYLYFSRRDIEEATIPPFIKRIGPYAFECCKKLKQINFPTNSNLEIIDDYAFSKSGLEKINQTELLSNSKLKSIGKYAFDSTKIESFFIPSSLEDLKKGWCSNVLNLNDIKVAKENKNFIFYDNKFLLGKTEPKNDIYDYLYFARRDIEEATIPPFIKRIGLYAFGDCENLKEINFPTNSKLEIIEDYAFYNSGLENILIPSSVTLIGKYSFGYSKIQKIDLPNDSQLKIIDNDAFTGSDIDSITIPSSITKFNIEWYDFVQNLFNINIIPNEIQNITYFDDKFILGKSDYTSNIFDILLFAKKNIEKAIIPNFVKKIASYSFMFCTHINEIEFQHDSQLEIIESGAFYESSIKEIIIPRHVKRICIFSFTCLSLTKLQFEKNSELQKIEDQAFTNSKIRSISIPESVTEIENGAFEVFFDILIIEIPDNSQLHYLKKETIGDSLLMIPSTLIDKIII